MPATDDEHPSTPDPGAPRIYDELCDADTARRRLVRDRQPDADLRAVLVPRRSGTTGQTYLVRRWGVWVDGVLTGTLRARRDGRVTREPLPSYQGRDWPRLDDGTPARLGVPYTAHASAPNGPLQVHRDPRCARARVGFGTNQYPTPGDVADALPCPDCGHTPRPGQP